MVYYVCKGETFLKPINQINTFNMTKIHLNGANAQKIADKIGATIIIHDITNDTILVAGGDIDKLPKGTFTK